MAALEALRVEEFNHKAFGIQSEGIGHLSFSNIRRCNFCIDSSRPRGPSPLNQQLCCFSLESQRLGPDSQAEPWLSITRMEEEL